MNIEENIRRIMENQWLILERIAHLESDVHAIFQVQGTFLEDAPLSPAEREDRLTNYSRLPAAMLEAFQKASKDKFRPFQP